MDYFQELPNDIRYVVYTHLKIHDVFNISKAFEIYVDYEKIFMLMYSPQSYIDVKEGIKDDQWYNSLYSLHYPVFGNKK
jgi:hypothetical protein